MGQQQWNETIEDAVARLKNEARSEVASAINIIIEKHTKSEISSLLHLNGGSLNETASEFFQSSTQVHSQIELSDLGSDIWQDPHTKELFAFSWLSRGTLIRQTEGRISTTIGKINRLLDQADILLQHGYKIKMRNTLSEVGSLFSQAEQLYNILTSITNKNNLKIETETSQLFLRFDKAIYNVSSIVSLFIKCDAIMEGKPFYQMQQSLKGYLSDQLSNCKLTDESSQADIVVRVSAETRDYHTEKFYNANVYTTITEASIIIEKQILDKTECVYNTTLSGKGVHTINYEEAARAAYNNLTEKTAKLVTEVIKKQL